MSIPPNGLFGRSQNSASPVTSAALHPKKSAPLRLESRHPANSSSEGIVETSEQLQNGLLRFIAHVGQAERFPAEFAVAGVDDDVMFLAKAAGKIDNVDAMVVFDAGERF